MCNKGRMRRDNNHNKVFEQQTKQVKEKNKEGKTQ